MDGNSCDDILAVLCTIEEIVLQELETTSITAFIDDLADHNKECQEYGGWTMSTNSIHTNLGLPTLNTVFPLFKNTNQPLSTFPLWGKLFDKVMPDPLVIRGKKLAISKPTPKPNQKVPNRNIVSETIEGRRWGWGPKAKTNGSIQCRNKTGSRRTPWRL